MMTLQLVLSPEDRAAKIAALNDAMRANFTGSWLMTVGVRELIGEDPLKRSALMRAIHEFKDFEEGDDPYRERDFGALTFDGQRLFWKIDYYDKAREFGSPNPADSAVTHRVMTIMLASEY